jgi:hypothetical protein
LLLTVLLILFWGPAAAPQEKSAQPAQLGKVYLPARYSAATQQPDHPGGAHCIIHTYDFAPLVQWGGPGVPRYAAIAPSSPPAPHTRSPIFARLGMWPESTQVNRASATAGKAYTAKHLPGWMLGLHTDDCRTYAYRQWST